MPFLKKVKCIYSFFFSLKYFNLSQTKQFASSKLLSISPFYFGKASKWKKSAIYTALVQMNHKH